jgi:hypothetical protein
MGKRGPQPGANARAAAMRATATLRKRYGADYFSRLAVRGGMCVLLRQADPERFYALKEKAGTIGGNTTLARYGVEQYAAWGRKSAEMCKEAMR